MNRNAVARIIIYTILILVLLAILLVGLGVKLFSIDDVMISENSFVSQMLTGERDTHLDDTTSSSRGTADASVVRNLDIEWVSGSITITYGDVTEIMFDESGKFNEDDSMTWKVEKDKLIIRFDDKDVKIVGFGINNIVNKNLTVTLPKGWIGDEIEIESVSADVDIRQLQARKIDLENVSGEAVLTDCAIDDVNIEVVSGNLEFVGALKSLSCESVSAECILTLQNVPSSIEMETVSGNLTLILEKDFGFTVHEDTAGGKFISDFPVKTNGKKHTYGDGGCRMEISGVSGNIIIRSGISG